MQFDFFIGGFMGESFRLHVKKGILHCETFGEGYVIRPELTKLIPVKDNQDFKAILDYLSTRKWKGVYDYHDTMDGTTWNLIVKTDNFSFNIGGTNLYPRGFFKFLKLLNVITLAVGIRVS